MIQFQWQGDDDEAKCEYGDHLLRAECVDNLLFWWAVYENEERITYGYAQGMPEAMRNAEQIVREL